MVISHKLRLIYFKLYKVAGSSFEAALSKYCGEHDIVPMGSDHSSASTIKSLVSPDIWNDYLKVCSVRDPYDQCISEYFFTKDAFKKSGRHYSLMTYSFPCFIRYKYVIGRLLDNMEMLHVDGKIAADFLIRFEHIDEDIEKLERKIDCPGLLRAFQGFKEKSNLRPSKGASVIEMFSKYPAEKLIIDSFMYENINRLEYIREYWPAYKAKLDLAIGDNDNLASKGKPKLSLFLMFLRYVYKLGEAIDIQRFVPVKVRRAIGYFIQWLVMLTK